MFNIMAGVGAVGVLSFALLRPVTREAAEAEKEQPAGAQASTTVSEQLFEVRLTFMPGPRSASLVLTRPIAGVSKRPVGDRYKQVVRLVLKVDMLLLAPAIIYTGFTQAFFPGQIPLFIYNFNGNNDLDYDSSIKLVRCGNKALHAPPKARSVARPLTDWAPARLASVFSDTQYVMACLGACSSFGSLVFGRVSDRFGRLPVLALAGLFHGCGRLGGRSCARTVLAMTKSVAGPSCACARSVFFRIQATLSCSWWTPPTALTSCCQSRASLGWATQS